MCCLYLPSFPYHQPISTPPLYSLLASLLLLPSSMHPLFPSSILPFLIHLAFALHFFLLSPSPPSLLDLFLQSFPPSSFSPRSISSLLPSLFLLSSIYFCNPSLPLPSLFDPSLLFSFSFHSSETGYRGMWHDPDHLAERSHCLNQLARIYNWTLPLQYSDIAAIPFQRTWQEVFSTYKWIFYILV